MNSKKLRILNTMFPFIALFIILLIFTILVPEKFWTQHNLNAIIGSWAPLAIGGAGLIFVNSQGSIDISLGATLAFSALIGVLVSEKLGAIFFVPVCIIVGMLIGAFNGFILGKFKVPSIMVTLATMMSLTAIVNYGTSKGSFYLNQSLLVLNKLSVKAVITIIILLISAYLFKYTKLGFFSRCIGENEEVARYSGVNVLKYKVLAFGLGGLLVGLAGSFNAASVGGVIPNMGNMYQLQIVMGLYLGGAPVSGGALTKYRQLVLGSITLAVLQRGLTLTGVSAAISSIVQGLILILVIFIGVYSNDKFLAYETQKAIAENRQISIE